MLIRQTLAYLPAQIIGPLTQFATVIILTHFLGAADFGMTMLVFASQELIFISCLSWWTIYVLRYAERMTDEAARARLRRTEAGVLSATAVLQIFVTIAVIFLTEPEVSPAFYLGACLFTVTRSYLAFLSERARGKAAILDYSLVQIATPLGGLMLTLLVMMTLGARPGWVLLVYAIVQGAVGLGIGLRLGLMPAPGMPDRAMLRAALAFGVPVVFSTVLGWIVMNGIRFVVQGFDGPVALGLVSVGWGLALRLAAVAAMVVTAAAYPLAVKAMASGDAAAARRQISDNSALLLALVAPATLGVIAINEPLTRLLIAAEYQAMTIAILPWALASAAIRNVRGHGWDQMFLLFEAPRPMLAFAAVEAVLTMLAATVGILTHGVIGAVIGTTIAGIVIAMADFAYLKSRFGLHAPFWQYARILGAGAAMFGVLSALPRLGLPVVPLWHSVAMAILIGMLAYALAMALLFPGVVRAGLAKLRSRRATLPA